jgi:hypothetical protein
MRCSTRFLFSTEAMLQAHVSVPPGTSMEEIRLRRMTMGKRNECIGLAEIHRKNPLKGIRLLHRVDGYFQILTTLRRNLCRGATTTNDELQE